MDEPDRATGDLSQIALQLRQYLSQPVRTVGPGEPWSPEYDVIQAIRRLRHPILKTSELTRAAAELLATSLEEIDAGERSPETIALVARLGYLCSSLALDVDGTPFFLIGLNLATWSGLGRPVDPQDLFQILRAAGRSELRDVRPELRRLFWSTLLDVHHDGIRTLAAQNLVRLDPLRSLVELPAMMTSGVNAPLLAHELLDRLGERHLVLTALTVLAPEWVARLAEALADAGHTNIATALLAKARPRAAGKAVAPVDRILAVLGVDEGRGDREGLVLSVVGRAGADGLRAATRPDTVRRFMSHGGVAVAQDLIGEIARPGKDLAPPSLMDA